MPTLGLTAALTTLLLVSLTHLLLAAATAATASCTDSSLSDTHYRPGTMSASLLPVLVVSHGSPMLLLSTTASYYKALTQTKDKILQSLLPATTATATETAATRPSLKDHVKAILIVSAHWETSNGVRVSGDSSPSLIYDFGGFDASLYKYKYPAPGQPALAERVASLITGSGASVCTVDPSRGWDHGAWVPLALMFPEADIPVVQLSINRNNSPQEHIKIGHALSTLRSEGVLIIASGSVTHNLQELRTYLFNSDVDMSDPNQLASLEKVGSVPEWARRFEAQFVDIFASSSLTQAEKESKLTQLTEQPIYRRAHPSPDHFTPYFVALGASEAAHTKLTTVFRGFAFGSLSMTSFFVNSEA